MLMETLYKKSKNGKMQQWSIEVQGCTFRTIEGFVGGALTPTEWTTCIAKRQGASNATTADEQAVKEAEAKIKKQKDKGWVENIEDVDKSGVIIKPMLAFKWDEYKEWMLQQTGVAIQPKLDGIRCIATKDGLFTRNGKPIVAAPHVWEEVQQILEGCPDVKLDGELYNHQLKEDFNTITSIVRKQKPTDEDLQKSKELLQYHVYDIDIPHRVFASRSSTLQNLVLSYKNIHYVKIVDTAFLSQQQLKETDLLDKFYAEYLQSGYEGQMIRAVNSNYENNRAKCLLKRKEFEEQEFIIKDIEEGLGNRSGMMGRIKFEGFDANARGTYEFFKELLINKHNYIGKLATVRYQNLTPDGVPRFPVVIAIRDYE